MLKGVEANSNRQEAGHQSLTQTTIHTYRQSKTASWLILYDFEMWV